jgi:hypothetical protein
MVKLDGYVLGSGALGRAGQVEAQGQAMNQQLTWMAVLLTASWVFAVSIVL